MKRKFLENISVLPYLLLLLYCIVTVDKTVAGSNPEEKVKHWDLDFSISPFYDSNILKYSDKYITRFLNRQDEGRFHINRYDDLVTKYSVGLSYSNEFIKKLESTFSFDFSYNRYSFNTVKNWVRYSVSWRQDFLPTSSFMISYAFIPHFYVRHFRDEDWITVYGYVPITFKPYEFSKDDFSFWIQHNIFKGTRARAYFSFMRYFLDPDNTEYDSKDYMGGIRVYQQITNDLIISAGYKYTYSNAKGYDQPGETKQTSDDVDATNYSHTYLAGISYKLPVILKMSNNINIDVEYERCFFTTNHFYELDPIHAGRNDKNYDIAFTYNINLPGDIQMSAFYTLLGRKTATPAAANAEYISDEKSYEQYQTGIEINYNFKF
jgi:hypothetical protein